MFGQLKIIDHVTNQTRLTIEVDHLDTWVRNLTGLYTLVVSQNGAPSNTLPNLLTVLDLVIKRDIVITIPKCTHIDDLERHLDGFLAKSRVWTYVYQDSGVCNRIELKRTVSPPSAKKHLFYRMIERLQFPDVATSCHERHILIHEMNNRGMFSTLHFAAYALTRSVDWQRTFLLDDRNFSFVGSGGWTDLLLPISSCQHTLATQRTRPQQLLNNFTKEKDYLHDIQVSVISNNYLVYQNFMMPDRIPPGWFDSLLKFRSYIMDWMIRPNYEVRQEMKRLRSRLWGGTGHPPRYVSVHVRNGDKRNETGTVPQLHEYMDYIVNVTDNGKTISHIFLMTDNVTVLEETVRYPQMVIYLQKCERSSVNNY
eukprot:gene14370-16957_t